MKIAAVVLLALVLVGVVAAGSYYVVSGKGQTAFVPKAHFSLTPVFVDVDNWSVVDLITNHEIAMQILRAGKGGMLPGGGVIDAFNAVGRARAAVVDEFAGKAAQGVSQTGSEAQKDVGQAVDKALESHPEAQQALQQGADALTNAGAQAKAVLTSPEAQAAVEKGKAALSQFGDKLQGAVQKRR